ncbi:MAG: hypothetical protein U0T83_10550 [Bacteriovoracaceae bacterium]
MFKIIFLSILYLTGWQLFAVVDTSKNLPSVVVKERIDNDLLAQTKIEYYPQVSLLAIANISGFYDKFVEAFLTEYSFLEESDRKKFNYEFKIKFLAKALNLEEKQIATMLTDFKDRHEAFVDLTNREVRDKLIDLDKKFNSRPKL